MLLAQYATEDEDLIIRIAAIEKLTDRDLLAAYRRAGQRPGRGLCGTPTPGETAPVIVLSPRPPPMPPFCAHTTSDGDKHMSVPTDDLAFLEAFPEAILSPSPKARELGHHRFFDAGGFWCRRAGNSCFRGTARRTRHRRPRVGKINELIYRVAKIEGQLRTTISEGEEVRIEAFNLSPGPDNDPVSRVLDVNFSVNADGRMVDICRPNGTSAQKLIRRPNSDGK